MRGTVRLYTGLVVGFMIMSLFAMAVAPFQASAAINSQINFQGKLTNPDGTNVTNGSYSIRFRIYDHITNDAANTCLPGSNSCKFEDTQTLTVTDGIFSYALGSNVGATLPGSVDFNNSSLYIGVKVGTDAEMTPRIQLTAAPYAFNSSSLNGIADTGFVKLGQVSGATGQTDASNNSSIYVNKTTGTGNILQLQKAGSDVFSLSNTGNITATGTYNTNTFSSTGLQFGGSGAATVQSAATFALNLTGHNNSTLSTDAGTLTVQGFAGLNLNTPNATTATSAISLATGNATTTGATGSVTIATGNATSGTAGNISIDNGTSSTGTPQINVGTSNNPRAIAIGNNNATTTASISAGNGVAVNGNTTVTGLSTGTGVALTVSTNGNANNKGLRINTTGSTSNAFEVFSAAASAVTAAFDNAGDLFLGATNAASGALLTPNTGTAATNSSALTIASGDSTTSGNSGAVSFKSGSATSGTSGTVTIQSGNVTTGTAGNVAVDTGTSSTGTPQLNLGTTNARTITLGNTTAATTVATLVGTGTSAFSVQGASSAVYMRIDTTNNRLYVGNPTADATAFLLVQDYKNTAGDPAAGSSVNGGSYYNSANNKFRCYQNSIWMDCGNGFNTITKAADQVANSNSNAFQNDTALVFAVNANTTYVFDAWVPVNDSNATADFKYTFTTPAGATLSVMTSYPTAAATQVLCNITASGQTCANTTFNNANHFVQMRGQVTVGGTAGNVQFQFAQNTANAAASPTIKKGATLSWHQSN